MTVFFSRSRSRNACTGADFRSSAAARSATAVKRTGHEVGESLALVECATDARIALATGVGDGGDGARRDARLTGVDEDDAPRECAGARVGERDAFDMHR